MAKKCEADMLQVYGDCMYYCLQVQTGDLKMPKSPPPADVLQETNRTPRARVSKAPSLRGLRAYIPPPRSPASGLAIRLEYLVLISAINITGDHIKQDLRYTQKKPIYFAFFTNNIWSYLLWSPVIVEEHKIAVVNFFRDEFRRSMWGKKKKERGREENLDVRRYGQS